MNLTGKLTQEEALKKGKEMLLNGDTKDDIRRETHLRLKEIKSIENEISKMY